LIVYSLTYLTTYKKHMKHCSPCLTSCFSTTNAIFDNPTSITWNHTSRRQYFETFRSQSLGHASIYERGFFKVLISGFCMSPLMRQSVRHVRKFSVALGKDLVGRIAILSIDHCYISMFSLHKHSTGDFDCLLFCPSWRNDA